MLRAGQLSYTSEAGIGTAIAGSRSSLAAASDSSYGALNVPMQANWLSAHRASSQMSCEPLPQAMVMEASTLSLVWKGSHKVCKAGSHFEYVEIGRFG